MSWILGKLDVHGVQRTCPSAAKKVAGTADAELPKEYRGLTDLAPSACGSQIALIFSTLSVVPLQRVQAALKSSTRVPASWPNHCTVQSVPMP